MADGFFISRTGRTQWTDLYQNWHVCAIPAKDVPFGGLDDDQSRLGVQTPKNNFLGA